MPVSKDKDDWSKLPDKEKRLVEKVFGGLTSLDTLQSEVGADALKPDARTQQEIAVLNNIVFMESEHARSYSSIFSTLNTNKEIREIFEWIETNTPLQRKAEIVNNIYKNGTPLQKKVASVFLESFLFYSGFYTPLYYLGNSKLMNVAEVIKLIIRDESVHGQYIGYKFQLGFKELPEEEKNELRMWAYNLLYELYENECKYTEYLYDEVGWTEDVKTFLRYNANKALMNLGLDPLFPDSVGDVNPIVINGISTGTTNHDFFSAVGNGYLMSVVEDTKDSDYDFMRAKFAKLANK
jgi:ribonucleoside-diphosphate reductase beta chain